MRLTTNTLATGGALTADCKKNPGWRNFSVKRDEESAWLKKKWLSCYLMYDWNIRHAQRSFDADEANRYQSMAKRLTDTECVLSESEGLLTRIYNEILEDDVNGFIECYMRAWSAERKTVEKEVAQAMSQVFGTEREMDMDY